MISKALVVGAYQRKLEEIAAQPGIDLTVIVPPAWGGTSLEKTYTQGYRLLVEPIRFADNFHLHTYPTLPARIREVRPHILHIDEEPYNLATFQAVRQARRAGAKTLFFTWQNIERHYPPPFSWMEQYVLRHADYALMGNQEAVGVWRRKGYGGPLAVIPQFGVDPELFAPASPPAPLHRVERGEKKRFVIGYAGRLVAEKGLDVLIKAAAKLPGHWLLRLAGAGPERAALNEMAGVWNIGGSVEFLPPIASTEMPAFYHSLDALVLPSRTLPHWKEQFGRVLIEAMACGVPVIGSRSGAIPEVIGEAGLLFTEGDEHALQTCLLSLMEHPRLRQQLIEQGRARVIEQFTQKHIAEMTVERYRNL
jgi:glycosyltransferase involved in cell wall biosynthesis